MIQPESTVRLVSDFTIEVFGRYLENDPGSPHCQILHGPFGQVFQQLLTPLPPEATDQDAVVWTLPEAVVEPFAKALHSEETHAEDVLNSVDVFADALLTYSKGVRSLFVATWVSMPSRRGYGVLDWRPGLGLSELLARMNLRLAARLSEAPNIFLLDAQRWLQAAGPRATSSKLWFTSKVPFGNAVFQEAAADVKAAILGTMGKAKKLVVTDLDGIMWGGVVGETGWAGLDLGGHSHRGEAFVAYQRALKSLTRRGVLLAIVSKNDEAVALEAIDQHPEMVLRRTDFAGWRINWGDKAQNLAELVDELNLGTDAVVFIDDEPVQRGRVRYALPGVLVVDMPRDPTAYADVVSSLRCFDAPSLSPEDRTRATMAVTERKRDEARGEVRSLEEWLAELEITVSAFPFKDSDSERIAQLLNKTNQMNLRTRRMTEPQLSSWLRDDAHSMWTFRVADRFGDYGLTGLVGFSVEGETAEITDFVLSCRVMGRRVEETMAHLIVDLAYAQGASEVVAEYEPTPRNAPCLRFWEGSGFEGTREHLFRWAKADGYPLPGEVSLLVEDG
jgi:FkbH-like protein